MRRFTVALLAGLSLIGSLQAAMPEWEVRVSVRNYQAPVDRALALMPRLQHRENAAAAVRDLESDVQAGQAQRIFDASLRTVPNQLASIRRSEETPLGYQPKEWPLLAEGTPGQPLAIPYFFRSFGTRDIGYRCDIHPEQTDAGLMLAMNFEHSRIDGMERWELGYENEHTLRYLDLPKIATRRLGTRFLVINDQPMLTGVWHCLERKGTVILQIVTAQARRLTPVPAPAPPKRETDPPVYMETQSFRLNQLDALELRPQLLEASSVEQAYQQLLAWRAAGQAEMTAWHGGLAGCGQSILVQNQEERLVPHGPYFPYAPPSEKEVERFLIPFQYHGTPFAPPAGFEHTPANQSLSVMVSRLQDGRISATIVEHRSRWLGYRRWTIPRLLPKLSFVYFPILQPRSSTQVLEFTNGQRILSSFQKAADSDQIEITLLRASSLSPAVPANPPSK